MELLSPKLDIVFKSLFTAADSTDILSDFLASVLDVDADDIHDIEILNGEMLPDTLEQKYSRLDITLKIKDSFINVEMQVKNLSDFKERILFYWSKLYCRDLKEGESYRNLKQTISINILDFKMFECRECHSVFHLREDSRNEILTDKCRFDFLELPKAETDNSRQVRRLRRWLRFFNMNSEEDAEMIVKSDDKIMNKAVLILRKMSADEKIREAARIRERALHDEASYIQDARAEGLALGMERGMEKGMEKGMERGMEKGMEQGKKELVFNMFQTKQSVDLIKLLTGFSEDRIEQYRYEFDNLNKDNI